MGYWKEIARSAAKLALKDAKLDNTASAVIAFLVQGIIALGIFLAIGQFTQATAVTRALTAVTPFLAYPVAFVIRFVLAPALHFRTALAKASEHAERLQAQIDRLQNPPLPEGRDETIYQDGHAAGNVVGATIKNGPLLIFEEIENCTVDFSRAFIFLNEILYFQRERVSGLMIMGRLGPRMNVRTGVEAFVLGNLSSVRLPA